MGRQLQPSGAGKGVEDPPSGAGNSGTGWAKSQKQAAKQKPSHADSHRVRKLFLRHVCAARGLGPVTQENGPLRVAPLLRGRRTHRSVFLLQAVVRAQSLVKRRLQGWQGECGLRSASFPGESLRARGAGDQPHRPHRRPSLVRPPCGSRRSACAAHGRGCRGGKAAGQDGHGAGVPAPARAAPRITWSKAGLGV